MKTANSVSNTSLKTLLSFIAIYSILFILIEILATLSDWIGFIVYFMLFLFSIGFLFVNIPSLIQEDPVLIGGVKLSEKEDKRVRIVMVYLLFILSNLLCYCQMCRYNNILYHSFSTTDNGYSSWTLFGIKNLVNALLLNAPINFGWMQYSIVPLKLFAKISQFAFQLTIEFLLISKVYELLKFISKKSSSS